jgi:hypothetical protein
MNAKSLIAQVLIPLLGFPVALAQAGKPEAERPLVKFAAQANGGLSLYSAPLGKSLNLKTEFGPVALRVDRIVNIKPSDEAGLLEVLLTNHDVVIGSVEKGQTIVDTPEGPVDLADLKFKSLTVLGGKTDLLEFRPFRVVGLPKEPRIYQVGDFNGDGRVDLAILEEGRKAVGIYLDNGTGGLALREKCQPSKLAIDSMAVADLDNDKKDDLLISCHSREKGVASLKITVFPGGEGSKELPAFDPQVKTLGRNHYSFVPADLNKDGNTDLLVSTLNRCTLSVVWGNGDGTFTPKFTFDTDGNTARSTQVADLNGDGWPDIVTGYDWIDVFLSNGSGGVTSRPCATLKSALPTFLGLPISIEMAISTWSAAKGGARMIATSAPSFHLSTTGKVN